MKKEIVLNYNRMKEFASENFQRICPDAGSKVQRQQQEEIMNRLKRDYDELLLPRMTLHFFEGGILEQGDLLFCTDRPLHKESLFNAPDSLSDSNIRWKGIFPKELEAEVKAIICYGLSIPEWETEEQEDMLEAFYLDCWTTALLDGTREWIKEYLKESIVQRGEKIIGPIGPGFFGMDMTFIPGLLEMIDGKSIGIREFHGGLYPPKSNLGFYLVIKGETEWMAGDCSSCLAQGKNCMYCMNSPRIK